MPRLKSVSARMTVVDTGIARLPAKVTDPFYRSAEWRALVASVKRERGCRCVRCGASGGRIIGDHVSERRDGGADLDARNIQLLCMACHNRKTAEAARARAARPIG